MSLHLKVNLAFPQNIMFSGFLPEAEADWLHVNLGEGKYRLTLYLSHRKKQLDNVSDIPTDPEELKHYVTLYCSSLTVEIEATEVDLDIVNALEAGQPAENTEGLAREIFDVVLEVHNGLVSYFRNMAKEYWLEPLAPDPRNYRQFIQHRWRLSWLDSRGEWRPFPFTKEVTGYLTAQLQERGVDRDKWTEVAPFIERGARAPMRHVLIANSLQHLSQRNGRLAVVEAVIALESALKQLLPGVILDLLGIPQTDAMRLDEALDSLIHKAGLWPVTELGVEMIWTKAGPTREDIDTVRDAINVRHQVVHDPRREVSTSDAHEYVFAVRRLIAALETCKTNSLRLNGAKEY
jgi:hypothetical protein